MHVPQGILGTGATEGEVFATQDNGFLELGGLNSGLRHEGLPAIR